MKMMLCRRVIPVIAIGALLALAAPGAARAQCAMCEGSAAAGSDSGASYNHSTLFMLSMPYLLLGGIGGYVVYAFRRSRNGAPAAPEIDSPTEEEKEQG